MTASLVISGILCAGHIGRAPSRKPVYDPSRATHPVMEKQSPDHRRLGHDRSDREHARAILSANTSPTTRHTVKPLSVAR